MDPMGYVTGMTYYVCVYYPWGFVTGDGVDIFFSNIFFSDIKCLNVDMYEIWDKTHKIEHTQGRSAWNQVPAVLRQRRRHRRKYRQPDLCGESMHGDLMADFIWKGNWWFPGEKLLKILKKWLKHYRLVNYAGNSALLTLGAWDE